MLRQIRREGHVFPDDTLVVCVHPEIAELLATADHEFLEALEKRLQKKISIRPRERFHIEHFEIRGLMADGKADSRGDASGERDKSKDASDKSKDRRDKNKDGLEKPKDKRERLGDGLEKPKDEREKPNDSAEKSAEPAIEKLSDPVVS